MDTPVAAAPKNRLETAPRWANRLFAGLVPYVAAGVVLMVTGFGGPTVAHYVHLMWSLPALLTAVVICSITARCAPAGDLRRAWVSLALAMGFYFIGESIGAISWLRGFDPFPGPADFAYVGFYTALPAAAIFLIRAAAVRVPWVQLSMDATIFAVGFGAFFWFLVLHPSAELHQASGLKQVLSMTYNTLDCILLLLLGVLLLTGSGNLGGQRVPLLLLTGFATMFGADIVWSLAKMRGYYLPTDNSRSCTS